MEYSLTVVAFLVAFFSYIVGWWAGYRKAIHEWDDE